MLSVASYHPDTVDTFSKGWGYFFASDSEIGCQDPTASGNPSGDMLVDCTGNLWGDPNVVAATGKWVESNVFAYWTGVVGDGDSCSSVDLGKGDEGRMCFNFASTFTIGPSAPLQTGCAWAGSGGPD